MTGWILVGAVNGFLAVAAGAFGAHALAPRVEPRALEIFETAAHYHLTHALAILATAAIAQSTRRVLAKAAAWLFAAGIVLFSGSLYIMGMTGLSALGIVTPFGGVSLLAGWAALALAALKRA